MENPPKKFFRLSPGMEVRLRYAYFVTCREAVKNAAGEVVELRCTYDPATRGGNTPPDGRKVKATLHWVSAADSVPAEVRVYQSAVRQARSRTPGNFAADLNPNSLEVLADARLEPALAANKFERAGAVRASGLFLLGRRLRARPARVQPHGRACGIPGRRWRAGNRDVMAGLVPAISIRWALRP